MWKNSFKTRSNLIKGSERKKLKESLVKEFPEISREDLDTLIPIKGDDIYVHKVLGTRILVYANGKDPLFFDMNGKGDFYPTGMSRHSSLVLLTLSTLLQSIPYGNYHPS